MNGLRVVIYTNCHLRSGAGSATRIMDFGKRLPTNEDTYRSAA
jgi:hypothetical protein